MKANIKMVFKFWLLILAFCGFADPSQDTFSFPVMELKQDKEIELEDLFSKLRTSSNSPIMIISNIPVSKDTLYFKTGKYRVEDVLKAFCDKFKGHEYYAKDKTIIIRQESLASKKAFQDALKRKLTLPASDKMKLWNLPPEPPEPHFEWSIPEDQITEDMRKAIEDDTKAFKAEYPAIRKEHLSLSKFYVSMQMQRFCFCFHGKEKEWVVEIDEYKDTSLGELFPKIISSDHFWCWLYEITDEQKGTLINHNSEIIKQVREQKREDEIDEGMLELLKPGPIYGIEIYRADYDPEEFDEGIDKGSGSPKQAQEEPSIPEVPAVLDGKALLKMSSVFSEKNYSLMVTIKNTSAGKLAFRALKDDFIIMELYDDKRGDTFERVIYAGEKTALPASFNLAAGESKTFEFKFDGSRFKEKYGRPFLIKEAGAENQLRLDKVSFKELTDLGARIETFYPIIYFDFGGKRYKSSGEETLFE